MEKPRFFTIQDVAKEAGVSKTTVSRFLNKSGYVDAKTAIKIEEAVKKLGYKPNLTAQTLKTQKSKNILLVVPDICNPFYSSMVKLIQERIKDKGYMAMLYNTNEDPAEELKAIETASDIRVAGMVFWSVDARKEILTMLSRYRVPVVLANSYPTYPFDCVHSGKGQTTYLTTTHLIEQGHRKIAYVGGAADSKLEISRRGDFMTAMKEHGLRVERDHCFEMDFTREAGYKFGNYFLSLQDKPTAVCCANDLIALGLLEAFQKRGVQVPAQVSVTGVDNITISEPSIPTLTTIDMNSTEFGEKIVELLLDRIDNGFEGIPRNVVVGRKLIIGESVGPVPTVENVSGRKPIVNEG